MSKVFISYRRDDSAGYAHAIHSRLVQHFSKDQVFMDVDTMEPGVDFVRAIEKAVGECDVLVALIGKRWAGGEPGSQSRFDNTKDYVRLEVSTALARDIRVIPVLVDGMTMPNEDSLPSSIQPITRRNAIEISNTRFNYDVDQLITAVRKILDATDAKRKADEEEERNRAQREVEQRRIEAETLRKLEEDRLLDEERQHAEKEAREKAEEENRRRIEEERNRAQREAERRRLEAEAQRKAEEERLREQERQHAEEAVRRKADEEKRRGIEKEVSSPWRTYGPVAVAVAVVLILFGSVFWWPKEQEAPVKETEGQKEAIEKAPMVKPQPPPKEIVASAPQKKLEAQTEIIRQPPAVKIPETRIETTPQRKAEAQKEVASKATVTDRKQEKPTVTQPVLLAGKVFRDRLKSGGDGPEMIVIPAGSFRMGDVQGGGEKSEAPVRTVKIQKPFAIGRYEVTFEEYDQFAKATNRQLPSDEGWGRGRRPAIHVSWQDAVEYAKWLSEQTGKRYRLPTEAEWEYAARAGTTTAYWWGEGVVEGMAHCDGCGSQWDNKQTAPVGSFKPNPFGLYDTVGNVYEWIEDCWHDNYSGAPGDGSAWKKAGGVNCGNQHMARGGSFSGRPEFLRVSHRAWVWSLPHSHLLGFRLAQDLD